MPPQRCHCFLYCEEYWESAFPDPEDRICGFCMMNGHQKIEILPATQIVSSDDEPQQDSASESSSSGSAEPTGGDLDVLLGSEPEIPSAKRPRGWVAPDDDDDEPVEFIRYANEQLKRNKFEPVTTSLEASPQLGVYFAQFGLSKPTQIAMCRTYASQLTAEVRAEQEMYPPPTKPKKPSGVRKFANVVSRVGKTLFGKE